MAAFNAQPAFQRTFGVERPNGDYELEAKWQVALANASKIGIVLGLYVGLPIPDHVSVSLTNIDQWNRYRSIRLQESYACCSVSIHMLQLYRLLRQHRRNSICRTASCRRASRCLQVRTNPRMRLGTRCTNVTSTLASLYATEVCPMVLRGIMTAYVNLCWVIGHLIGAGVLQSMSTREDQWGFRYVILLIQTTLLMLSQDPIRHTVDVASTALCCTLKLFRSRISQDADIACTR